MCYLLCFCDKCIIYTAQLIIDKQIEHSVRSVILQHLNLNNVFFRFYGLISRPLAVYCTSCVSSRCHLERVHWPFRVETSPFLTIQDIPEGCIA
jgi:hypothetical protein